MLSETYFLERYLVKNFAISLILMCSLSSVAQDINNQYQDSYGDKACMIFHIEHSRAQVFELVTAPTFFNWGRKAFRAAYSFDGDIVIENGNFDSICSDVQRIESKSQISFLCITDSSISFTVNFNKDNTVKSVDFKNKGSEYSCEALEGPFDA